MYYLYPFDFLTTATKGRRRFALVANPLNTFKLYIYIYMYILKVEFGTHATKCAVKRYQVTTVVI